MHLYRRTSRGFTLLELVATLVVVGVLTAAAVTRMQAPRDKAGQEEVRQHLSAVQLELARIASDSPDSPFADTLYTRLEASGLNFLAPNKAATDPSQVSVGPMVGNSMLAVAVSRTSDGHCLVLVYGFDQEGWGLGTPGPVGCKATNPSITEQAVDGVVRSPTRFNMA